VTVEDAPPVSRRALRAQRRAERSAAEGPLTTTPDDAPDDAPADDAPENDAPVHDAQEGADALAALIAAAPGAGRRVALGWVDDENLAPTASASPGPAPDLLARRPRRSLRRPGVVVPIVTVLALAAAYTGTTLLWPLHAVAPTVQAAEIPAPTGALSAIEWPEAGSAALGVAGLPGAVSSTVDADAIASITKVVTALVVLDEMPLAHGEQGPEFRFTSRDRTTYWNYLRRDESALDVPVGGTLTQYQLLQGILIASAGNYADRLASEIWPSDAIFAQAAQRWLDRQGLDGITVVEPTGIDRANTATPEALLALAAKALAHPVIAEIVGTRTAVLPGAGTIENTNDLLADPAVVGIKTGGLYGHYNLLAAKDVTVGGTAVRLYAAVLGQPTDALRDGETERLLTELTAEVSQPGVLAAGTVTGVVTTAWGVHVEVVTDADAAVVLWNGDAATATAAFRLEGAESADDPAGTLTLTGPLGSTTVDVRLRADIPPPEAWWRLTHPLQLFGLAG